MFEDDKLTCAQALILNIVLALLAIALLVCIAVLLVRWLKGEP